MIRLAHRGRNSWLALAAFSAAWIAGGCVTDPKPLPIPGVPDISKIYQSSASQADRVYLAGVPEAVPDTEGVEVVVINETLQETARAWANLDGSFIVEIGWREGDRMLVAAERDGRKSEQREIPVAQSVDTGIHLTVDSVTAAAGEVTVVGTTDPGWLVMLGNEQTGALVNVAAPTGSFTLAIPASQGDWLVAFATDPTTRTPSGVERFQAPGP
jgi:hypothetical protein